MRALISLCITCFCGEPFAQVPSIQRTVIAKESVSVPGREAIVTRVEIEPSGSAGRHSHNGDEIGYVLEGECELIIDGEPVRTFKAGEAFVIAGGKIHDARTESGTKVISTYFVEKGKPLAVPAK